MQNTSTQNLKQKLNIYLHVPIGNDKHSVVNAAYTNVYQRSQVAQYKQLQSFIRQSL